MRSCGLTQGTGRAYKLESLSAFIRASQELALSRHFGRCQRKARKAERMHNAFIPEEVVSIDIGFRNLAFVHMSKSGEVIEWRRNELLKEATFEPWILAEVVQRFVQERLPVRPASACTYIIEHQRFRSQGSAAVTNSVMVNNLVEALLYANLRNVGAHVEPVSPSLVSAHWGFIDGNGTSGSDITESADGAKLAKRRSKTKMTKSQLNSDLSQLIVRMDESLSTQRQITSDQQLLIMQALGEKSRRRSTRTATHDLETLALETSSHLSKVRELRRRAIKKERTIGLIQSWILESLVTHANQNSLPVQSPMLVKEIKKLGGARSAAHVLPGGFHVTFPLSMIRMFGSESKKDDLCDCILQAAAWYAWQHNVIDALNTYGSTQLLSAASASAFR
ncbi:hypothetical protein EC988_004736 [Linderina pennispora]|nr:hypothetical protein EC988_004736 [Linderina pennispora]